MKIRRIISVLALIAGLVTQPLGNANDSVSAASWLKTRQFIEKNLPVGALGSRIESSSEGRSFTPPERKQSPSDFFAAGMKGNADSLLDPRNLSSAQRSLLEHVWQTKVLDLGSILSNAGPGQSSSGGGSESSTSAITVLRAGYPGGDLNGDSLEDVIEFKVAYDNSTYELTELKIEGLAGTTGESRWARDLLGAYDLFIMPANDIDGDGADDLVLLELHLDHGGFQGACTLLVCAVADNYSFTWKLSPLSGRNGLPLWTKNYEGQVQFVYEDTWALVAFQGAQAFKVTNGVVLPTLASRGDKQNVVVDALDFEGVFGFQYVGALVAGAFVGEQVVLTATRAEVADGATGASLMTRISDYQLGGALLLPSGHTVGDDSEDLIWENFSNVTPAFACAFALWGICIQPGSSKLVLEAIDGASFNTAWSIELGSGNQEWAGAWPLGHDLNADGSEDLLFFEYLTTGIRQGIISGSDGSLLWTTGSDWYLAVLGPVGGMPGDDLIAAEFAATETGYEMYLIRIDGQTGTQLFKTTHTVDHTGSGYTYVWAYLFGDADGDGTLDIFVGRYSYDWETGSTSFESIESGDTGDTIVSRAGTGDSILLPGGDLNSDGTEDALSFTLEYGRYRADLETTAMEMPSGEFSWTRTDSFRPYFGLFYVPTQDMLGTGGGDLIYNQFQLGDSHFETRILGIDGSTGVSTWSVGEAFSPPVEPTGAITGSVTTSSGGALSGICVSASRFYDPGYTLASATSDSSGGYTLPSLADGDYIVRFDDCGTGTYNTQWYDGKSDPASANAVSIVAGGISTGINASMVSAPAPVPFVLLRQAQRSYIGIGGDSFTSGPLPDGLLNDCSQDAPSTGGSCFDIRDGELAAEFEIVDSSGSAISGFYMFTDTELPVPNTFTYGRFCGVSGRLPVPSGAKVVWIFTQTLSSLWDCPQGAVPTTGTIDGSFFGPGTGS